MGDTVPGFRLDRCTVTAKSIVLAAALLAAGGAANAADMIYSPTPVAEAATPLVYDWSGAYAGVLFGYQSSSETELKSSGIVGSTSLDIEGANLGVYGGYNWQRGGFVYGLEADIQAVFDAKDSRTVTVVSGGALVASRYTGEQTWDANIRGRLGYAFNRILPYVTGGVSFAGYEANLVVPGVGTFNADEVFVEYSLGAGIEVAPVDNWHLRLEYLYEHFDGENLFTLPGGGVTGALKPHKLRFGAAYRFGTY